MRKLRAKRIGTGYYEVSTPHGTYRVENTPNPKGSGYGSGPNWLIISPGEKVADASKPTKREAMAYIQALCDETKASEEPAPVEVTNKSVGTYLSKEFPTLFAEPTPEDYSAAARHIERLMPGRWRRSS